MQIRPCVQLNAYAVVHHWRLPSVEVGSAFTVRMRAVFRCISQQRKPMVRVDICADTGFLLMNRQKIYERDGWICQICFTPVDPEIKWPDNMSPTLDHKIPWKVGDAHDPTGIRLAHKVCNVREAEKPSKHEGPKKNWLKNQDRKI